MRGTKGVVFTFIPARKTRQAAQLAQAGHALAPTREDFVRVSLMTHVPDQTVMGGIENVMQGNGQLDCAKVRAQVSAGFGDTFQHKRAQLVCQGAQLRWRQTSQICGGINIFQQRTHLTAFLANHALPLM
jgi:hypothetical protein